MNIDTRKKIVVYSVSEGHPLGKNNSLFNWSLSTHEHSQITPYLYDACLASGIQLVTPDVYLTLPDRSRETVFIRDSCTGSDAAKLIQKGLHGAILMVIEGPIYPVRFFYNLKQETEPYDYTFMPAGARPRVSTHTIFKPFICPQPHSQSLRVEARFSDRKYLTLITANKRIHPLRRLYVHVMNAIKPFPSFVDRELHLDRLRAVQYFSRFTDFDLYGRGFGEPVKWSSGRYAEAIRRSYRGTIARKLPVLEQYKFSLCFENCIFDGYVTEKIIDSMFAGCVPIYYGAPDITTYIPADCFIDFRKFKDFAELDQYLRSIDERTFRRYIEAINSFIASRQYYEYFSRERFAETVVNILRTYA